MEVQQRAPTTRRALLTTAAAAPALDVAGRLLAPTLLFAHPELIVLMSPTDTHVLLAERSLRPTLITLAFLARTARAWVVYEAFEDRRWNPTGRLAARFVEHARRSVVGAAAAVILLPGMPAGLVAAQVRLRRHVFLPALLVSNLAGIAFTVVAGLALGRQLEHLADVIGRHRLPFTGLAAVAIGLSATRRALRGRRRGDSRRLRSAGREPEEPLKPPSHMRSVGDPLTNR